MEFEESAVRHEIDGVVTSLYLTTPLLLQCHVLSFFKFMFTQI